MTATAKSNPISSPPSHCPRSPTRISIIDNGLVNPSVPALKFDAAASYALPQAYRDGCNHARSQILEELLLVSPYTAKAHLLDLSTLGKTDQLLAKALTMMKPSRNDYATSPYTDTFNWQTIIDTLRSLAKEEGYAWEAEAFYIVVFRSQVPPMTDRSHLGEMDRKSHEEAMKSGGLLKYWFGVPDVSGRNLATCKCFPVK